MCCAGALSAAPSFAGKERGVSQIIKKVRGADGYPELACSLGAAMQLCNHLHPVCGFIYCASVLALVPELRPCRS
jgi:hypothetical protein